MLGRLQMTVDECIDAFQTVWSKAGYESFTNAGPLELAIKKIITGQGFRENEFLLEQDAQCKVYVPYHHYVY